MTTDWADHSWADEGACRFSDPELFFPAPTRSDRARVRQENEALAVCKRCPVSTPCRDHALAADEREGIWGGLTALDRARITRPRDRRDDP